MKRILLLLCLFIATIGMIHAQSYAFGVKGGFTMGFQKWDQLTRQPLYKYHGIAFIESASEENKFAVFAQLGYHLKGSANRPRNQIFINSNGSPQLAGSSFSQEFIFKNISLTVGAKQKYELNTRINAYYLLGIRGDYTVGTNLKKYEDLNFYYPIYPFEGSVRKWNYGVTVGGGFEFPFTELISGILEITVNPDLSLQYQSVPLSNLSHPVTGDRFTLPERRISNTTFEVTVGFRFLNKVVYEE